MDVPVGAYWLVPDASMVQVAGATPATQRALTGIQRAARGTSVAGLASCLALATAAEEQVTSVAAATAEEGVRAAESAAEESVRLAAKGARAAEGAARFAQQASRSSTII